MIRLLTAVVGAAAAALAGSAWAETPEQVRAAAFEHAQMAVSTRTSLALAQSAGRLARTDPQLAELVRQRQEAEAQFRAVDAALATARARPDAAGSERVRVLANTLEAQRERLGELNGQLRARNPAFADLTSPAPLPLAEAQALLAPEEALLLIAPGPEATYLFALRRDRAAWARTSMGEAAVAERVRELRRALDPQALSRAAVDAPGEAAAGPAGFPRAVAHELYRAVWAPVEPSLTGAGTVFVVTGGELSNLPLSVLVTAPPKGADGDARALRATPWLIRRHALATLPSVASLKSLRQAEAPAAEGARPFAGFGDPLLAGAPGGADLAATRYLRSGAADVAALKALPALPGTRRELDAMARTLGAAPGSVKLGAAATESAVRAENLGDVRVVAFATHGLLAGDLAGLAEPALVLTPPDVATPADDGLLTASEAAQMRLSADWVVLSACNTAAGEARTGGEGLSGLARAFFYAGARALLVSHWRVRDDAAARLSTETLAAWRRRPQEGRAQALRTAMLSMMRSRDPALAHPSAWAPFVVAGDVR